MQKQKLKQRIKSGLKIKAFDHKIVDQSAKQIIETAERYGAEVVGPMPFRPKSRNTQLIVQALFIKTQGNNLK